MPWILDLPKAEWIDAGSEELDGLVREVCDRKIVALDTETTGLSTWGDKPIFWSLAFGRRRICMPITTLPCFERAFQDSDKVWVFANAKFDVHMLANIGMPIAGKYYDVQVMHGLLYDEHPHDLAYLGKTLLGMEWKDLFDKWSKRTHPTAGDFLNWTFANNPQKLIEYASNDTYATMQIFDLLKKQLEQAGTVSLFPQYYGNQWDIFSKIEAPFTKVLWKCERRGALIDVEYMSSRSAPILSEIERVERDACALAGKMINPGSNKQLQEYFFEELKLQPTKFTKGGKTGVKQPSVDESFLDHYADTVPMAKLCLEYRELTKTSGTYVESTLKLVDPNNRIHTRFNQTPRTGRLSCVAEWTKLHTTRGDIKISDVRVGDHVWTHKGRWRRVLDVFTKGIEHMYDVHLSNGQILTCTSAHRLLLKEGKWTSLQEILNEHFQEVAGRREEPNGSSSPLPIQGTPDCDGHRGATGHGAQQCHPHPEELHAGGRAEGSGKGPLLTLQDRIQEPHEGEVPGGAPQLERGVRGRVRVPDLPLQRKAGVCAPSGDDGGSWIDGASRDHGRASHRHEPQEQRTRQPGSRDESRASRHPLLDGGGLDGIEIEEVHYRGSCEVHDLTVEDDESYLACGVFSHNSSNPNLQNWPKPETDRFKLRGAIVAPEGHTLIVADYEALEMRLLAAASLEQDMIQIFLDGKDIHMGNAEMVFGAPYADLKTAKKMNGEIKEGKRPESDYDIMLPGGFTVKQCVDFRNDIKAVGFGANYGMKENKLARSLGCSVEKAKQLLSDYMGRYPAVRHFFDEAVEECRQLGFAFTVLGRRRFLPEIMSHSDFDRWQAERQAGNTQIQGSAADVVKMAMIHCDEANLEERYGCHMNLQVHDELMFECPDESLAEACPEIREWMEHSLPADLAVPLTISMGTGASWISAK